MFTGETLTSQGAPNNSEKSFKLGEVLLSNHAGEGNRETPWVFVSHSVCSRPQDGVVGCCYSWPRDGDTRESGSHPAQLQEALGLRDQREALELDVIVQQVQSHTVTNTSTVNSIFKDVIMTTNICKAIFPSRCILMLQKDLFVKAMHLKSESMALSPLVC